MKRYQIENKSIHTKEVRAREKILSQGTSNLSDNELMMVLLGSGVQGHPVQRLADKVLQLFDSREVQRIDTSRLRDIQGIGQAKATLLEAAHEFFRRRLRPASQSIKTPSDAFEALKHYGMRSKETFLTLSLNGAHEVIDLSVVSVGTVNKTLVHPREVFALAIQNRATAILAAHNHPSGNLDPSPEDHEVTDRLKKAGELLGIPLLDHIIFSHKGFISFVDKGWLH